MNSDGRHRGATSRQAIATFVLLLVFFVAIAIFRSSPAGSALIAIGLFGVIVGITGGVVVVRERMPQRRIRRRSNQPSNDPPSVG